MKKERNCGNTNYPVYPMMQQGMPMMPNMGMMPNMQMIPDMGMIPNMGMNSSIPTGSVTTNVNTGNYDEEIRRLEQRINMLERRLSVLETTGNTSSNYSAYNSSSYQML